MEKSEIVKFYRVEEVLEKAQRFYKQEKDRLVKYFPEESILHVGSTAIPGSLTKGDLDINIRVEEDDFKKTVEILKSLYDIAQPQNWSEVFASFNGDRDGEHIGVQVSVKDSESDNFIRDQKMFLENPELVSMYNDLKSKFDGQDMGDYRKAKAEFLNSIREKHP